MIQINEYLTILPNWKGNYIYRKRWQTSIQSSINGYEKRTALYTWPRRSLSFPIFTGDYSSVALLKRKLYKNLHQIWGVPFWQDGTILTSQAQSGQKTLNVRSTKYRNFEVNAPLIIFSNENNYEICKIDNLTENQIIVKKNLTQTWSTGTSVFPLLQGRLESGQAIDFLSSQISEANFEVKEEFDIEIVRNTGNIVGFPLYLGQPIFNFEPDWGKVTQTFIHPYHYLTFLGKTLSLSHYDETEFGLKMNILAIGKYNIQKCIDFFDAQMGKWGSFWLSSNQSDIKVTQPFISTDYELNIKDIQFPDYFLNKNAGKHILILLPGINYSCAEVVNATNTKLILGSSIGFNCNSNQLQRLIVSFLYYVRFDHDEIEIKYLTDDIAEIDLFFKTIFKEIPEIAS